MNYAELMKEIKSIEGDSIFELFHVRNLRKNASAQKRIDELQHDQKWLTDHIEMVNREIDALIYKLEDEIEEAGK